MPVHAITNKWLVLAVTVYCRVMMRLHPERSEELRALLRHALHTT